MPESPTQREVRKTILTSYRESLSRRVYSPGVYVWKETRSEYFVEGSEQDSIEQMDLEAVGALFEREKIETKESKLGFASFTESILLRLASEGESVIIRSRAIEELLRKESNALQEFLITELEKNDLNTSWRNTLLLATEHVEFSNQKHRERLRECLKFWSQSLKSEWHPRSQSALRAAIRILSSSMAEPCDSLDLLPFLTLNYQVRIKRIALLGIQDLFRDAPPPDAAETLTSFRRAIAIMAESHLTPSVCSESEDEFDLGLDALDALIQLADPCVLNLITHVAEFADSWAIKQIQETLHKTHEAWLKGEFPNRAACLDLVLECMDIVKQE